MHDKQPAVHVHMGATTFKPNLLLLTFWEGAFHHQNLKQLCEHGPSQPTTEEKKNRDHPPISKVCSQKYGLQSSSPNLAINGKEKGSLYTPTSTNM